MSSALTVGSFDGLHLGHQAVLRTLLQRAGEGSLSAELVTFDPHPLEILRPGDAPPLLTPDAERLALLAGWGLNRVHVLPFTAEFARLSAREFVREILVRELGCELLVVGEDHRFGHARAGGARELVQLGRELGLGVEVVARVPVDGEPASSTRTRQAIARGDLALAERLLGRRYGAFAPVVRGAGRGTGLGVPTVNLALSRRKQMPPEGIYACRALVRGRALAAAVHWGGRPTFGEAAPVLEGHLLGYEGDLYGQWVELAFVERLRDVVRFDGAAELARAMAEDLRRTAEIAAGTATA